MAVSGLWLGLFFLVSLVVAYLIYIYRSQSGQWKEGDEDPTLTPQDYMNVSTPEKATNEKRIVWVMHSYVPNVRAGSEITAEDQIQFLKKQGWTIYLLVHRWVVPEYGGIKIYPIEKGKILQSPGVIALCKSADIFCIQNYSINEFVAQTEHLKKPTAIFLHTQNDNRDILNFRMGVPVYVVYNVNYLKIESSNAQPSIVVHPKIDSSKFRIPKKNARYVTLINCNENKGGPMLPKLAAALPDIQFLGVKGGYYNQMMEEEPPKNLTYIDNQKDMTKVYEETKVLIMPSKAETWGRTAVEAMAGGTPVIVSRASGLLECVGKAVNACERSDLNCWVERIETLMKDEKAYEEAKAKSLARVEELDKEDEYVRLNTFLEDIYKRHSE